ncbi:MAG: hypothetical protein ACT4N4_01685 [Rhodospirillales bacterium]
METFARTARYWARGTARPRDFASLRAWSVKEPVKFWTSLWDFCGVIAETRGLFGSNDCGHTNAANPLGWRRLFGCGDPQPRTGDASAGEDLMSGGFWLLPNRR